jgi:hypothetical protein
MPGHDISVLPAILNRQGPLNDARPTKPPGGQGPPASSPVQQGTP